MEFAKVKHNGTAINTARANFKSGYKLIFLMAIATRTTTGAWMIYAV